MSFRKSLLWLHTWTGLTVGLLMVFFAITGSFLLARYNFEDVVDRDLRRVPTCNAPLSLDILAERAIAAHPASSLANMEITPDPGTSVAFQFVDKDYVYVDPCGGRVLGIQNQYGGFLGLVDWLHRFMFIENGRQIAGWMNAAILCFILIGGIVLWWPRSFATTKSAFTYNGRLPGLARTISLHKIVGVYAAVLLLVLSVTGVPMSLYWAKELVGSAAGSSPNSPMPPPFTAQPAAARLPLQELWLRAKSELPNLQTAEISLKKSYSKAVVVEAIESGAPHKEAKSFVYLDPYTGKTLGVLHYATDVGAGRKAYTYILALHMGLIGGVPFQLALLLACLSVPVLAYSGFSPYLRKEIRKAKARRILPLRLASKRLEAENVVCLEFVHARGGRLPRFGAGAHITLNLPTGQVRQYSLSNHPNERHRYVIAVLQVSQSRGGSRWIHDELKAGDVLDANLPRSHFPIAPDAPRALLIAGGIGITPIISMAESLSSQAKEFELHYCARSPQHAAYAARIAKSSFASRANFHFSEEGKRLNVRALLQQNDTQTHIYVCGPLRLIDQVVATATELGWPEGKIHREFFASAPQNTADDQPFDVKIASTGLVIHVPKDQSVCDALAARGIDIPTACGEGVCGTCLTAVVEGQILHRDLLLSAEERARNNQFTPCCSRAAGPMLVLGV